MSSPQTAPLSQIEHAGRRIGKPEGSYVDELASLRKAILLCWHHAPKFNAVVHHYFHEKNIHVRGSCDACRQFCNKGQLFMPLEYVEGANQTWTPQSGL